MKTFKDLVFEELSMHDGIGARMHFENGFGVSVVRHEFSYGGRDGLFELAVLKDNEIHYDNPVAGGDVVGYLRPEDVSDAMSLIQKFD
jgi:hypothetical protein